MLVLERLVGEVIEVTLPDGRVGKVQVVMTTGRKVKLGLTFPPDVGILRSELAGRAKEATEAA